MNPILPFQSNSNVITTRVTWGTGRVCCPRSERHLLSSSLLSTIDQTVTYSRRVRCPQSDRHLLSSGLLFTIRPSLTLVRFAVPADGSVDGGEELANEGFKVFVHVTVLQEQAEHMQTRVQVRPHRVVALALERLSHFQEVACR